MALLKKSAPVSAVSPERAALAAAIEAHNAYLAERAAANAAQGPAQDAVYAGRRAIDDAETDIKQAQADAAKHLIATAQGTAGPAPRTIREARDALTDAQDSLTAAELALEAVRARCEQLRSSYTESAVKAAVSAVLRADGAAAAAAVGAEVVRLQTEIVRNGQLLDFLIRADAFPVDTSEAAIGSNALYGKPADSEIRSAHFRLQNSPPLHWNEIAARHDGAANWRAALTALMTNAMAPLPNTPA